MMNIDGANDLSGILADAKYRDAHAMMLVDAERPRHHGLTAHLIKEKFARDAAVNITGGIKQLFGKRLGGTIAAVGKGWSQRCVSIKDDRFTWGRYSIIKIQGNGCRQIWIVGIYAPYSNKSGPESYYNLLKHEMQQYEHTHNKRLTRDANGDLCPTLQLISDLTFILQQAQADRAEVVIGGDFNEKWHENGAFRSWAESSGFGLKNVLTPDSITGGDTTCFPTSGSPSDIDWVLCTPVLHRQKLIRAGVLHAQPISSAHCPIYISIKAKQWLQLGDADIKAYKEHKYLANQIKGDDDDPRVQKYQKFLCRNWKREKVSALSKVAFETARQLESATANRNSTDVNILHKKLSYRTQRAYNAINRAFSRSIHKMAHTYSTGKKRLYFYSPPMVEIRRLRSSSRRLWHMWWRRTYQNNPFQNVRERGQNRAGRRNHRGPIPTMHELKKRLVAWLRKVAPVGQEIASTADSITHKAENLCVDLNPTQRAKAINNWNAVFRAIKKISFLLTDLLSAKNREAMKDFYHAKAEHGKKHTTSLKRIIQKLSDSAPRTGAISKIVKDGNLVTDPEKLATYMCEFYAAWFGKGRKNRWNCHEDGSSAHPLNDRNDRARVLVEALLEGNYNEIAMEHEVLPAAVQKLYDLGLLSYKTITKGPKKGQKVSPEDFAKLRLAFTPTEWRNARSKLKKYTHPGKDAISKPALFHCPRDLYMETGLVVFLAEEWGVPLDQFKEVQMWLIPKEQGVYKLDRLRALWFESEILKLTEFLMEGRVDALCRKLGIMEKEQTGFEKGLDCGSSIFPVAQLIEDSRVRNREVWLAFLDQAKAFDTLESFQGKLMASMVLGLPFKYAEKLVKFDESVIAEIITAFGTTWEILGFEKGTFTPECGGLQGGPRSPGMWKRFYDILIRAQNLVEAGKLAYIQGEDGIITLTSQVYADDTVLISGDHENMVARAKMQQLLVNYSGSNVKPPKCILTALLKDASGQGDLQRIPATSNIAFTDINTGITESCTIIGPDDRFRNLGWFSCLSLAADQAFNEMFSKCKDEVQYMFTQRTNFSEITKYVRTKTLPRVCYRMRYSTTGKQAMVRLQKLYTHLLRVKAKLIAGFPNLLIHAPLKHFGLGYVNFWDECSIDRLTAWFRHAHSGGKELAIVSAAMLRSTELHQSSTPTSQNKQYLPWDGTMLGRVNEWLSDSPFQILGALQNNGHRENDISVLDLVTVKADKNMIIEGCKISNLYWKSQFLQDDLNTWIPELQHLGCYTVGNYVWQNYRTDATTGERIVTRRENRWALWASKVKKLLQDSNSTVLGKHHECLPELKELDVVMRSDSATPYIVVKQIDNDVQVIKCQNTSRRIAGLGQAGESRTRPGRYGSQDCAGYRWNSMSMGLSGTSHYRQHVYTTVGEAMVTLTRCSVIRVANQKFPHRVGSTGSRSFRQPVLADALLGNRGKFGGVFFKLITNSTVTVTHMLMNNIISPCKKLQHVDAGNTCASISALVGEGNAGGNAELLLDQFAGFRASAAKYKKGCIIAGGDGSAAKKNGIQEGAYGWCVYGTGPFSVAALAKKSGKSIKVLASGGSADWILPQLRINTRQEKTHILAAMVALLPAGLNVLYAVDYTGAISCFNDVINWTANDWVNCEDRDVMEGILWARKAYKNAGLQFKCFHNKAHPEDWCHRPRSEYNALQEMAVLSDLVAKEVFTRQYGCGVKPYLPGQSRYKLQYEGWEVVAPIRKFLTDITRSGYIHAYISNPKHNGNFHTVDNITDWNTIETYAGKSMNSFSAISNAKYFYNRWATLAYQVKCNILSLDNDEQADLCSCGAVEDAWHLLSECQNNGLQNIRRKYSKRRLDMMIELGLSDSAIVSFRDNYELQDDGTYPDWNSGTFDWKHEEVATTSLLQTGKCCHSHWFQRGPLMSGFLEQSRAVLGVQEKKAAKFCLQIMNFKRIEADEIWQRRNDSKHRGSEVEARQFGEIRLELKKLVLDRRKSGLCTPNNSELIQLRRRQIVALIEDYKLQAEEAEASQPSVLQFFNAVGASSAPGISVAGNLGSGYVASRRQREQIAVARSIALRARRRDARLDAVNSTPRIDSMFEHVEEEGSSDEDTDVHSTEQPESPMGIVKSFIATAALQQNLDEDAELEISYMVENMLLGPGSISEGFL